MDIATRKELFALQLELECTRIESEQILVPFPCANPDPPARAIIANFGDRCEVFVRHDVLAPILATIVALDGRACFDRPELVTAILGGGDLGITRFRAYAFIDLVVSDDDSAMLLPSPNEQGFSSFGVMVGGSVVSGCSSVRENDRGGEAWVFTDEAHRRCGYARQAVLVWANHLQSEGKVPFYSHVQANIASRALAESLGLVPFVDAVGIG